MLLLLLKIFGSKRLLVQCLDFKSYVSPGKRFASYHVEIY